MADASWPGVQKPHWNASSAMKARCSGESSPSCGSPSTVRISAPSACAASRMHESVGASSTSTVQAPHVPSPQAIFVPVRPAWERISSARLEVASTRAVSGSPFSRMLTLELSHTR